MEAFVCPECGRVRKKNDTYQCPICRVAYHRQQVDIKERGNGILRSLGNLIGFLIAGFLGLGLGILIGSWLGLSEFWTRGLGIFLWMIILGAIKGSDRGASQQKQQTVKTPEEIAQEEKRISKELAKLEGRTQDDLKHEYATTDADRKSLITRYFADKGWGSPIDKVPCSNCGAMVLPATAAKTNGLCMPCHHSPNVQKKRKAANSGAA